MTNNSSIVCVFVDEVTFFTEPFPSNLLRHTDKDSWEVFMKYAIEIGSDAMTCKSNFIKIGSEI